MFVLAQVFCFVVFVALRTSEACVRKIEELRELFVISVNFSQTFRIISTSLLNLLETVMRIKELNISTFLMF
jgi:uncharacterized membrane protein